MRRILAVLAVLAIAALGGWLLSQRPHYPAYSASQPTLEWAQGQPSQSLAQLAGPAVSSSPPTKTPRVVYPYSVIPGGVRNGHDLEELSAHDRVVAQHFSGFNFEKAKIIELAQAQLVYLSYRIGNRVFWTRKRIQLRRGERLITDGQIAARTRCANRVSVLPQKEVSPAEPLAESFEQPIAGSAEQIPFPGNFQSALQTRPEYEGPGAAGPPESPGPGFGPSGGSGFPPISPPPLPGGGGCKPNKKNGGGKKCPPPPPPPVPEPGTILLVSSGLTGIYLRSRNSLRKK